MQFGLFDWVERQDCVPSETYRGRIDLARLADDAGFAGYHVAEHHGTPLSLVPSPSVLLAAIAGATTRLRLGPLVYTLPLYDPLRLIEEVCMLDQLSDGRLDLGIGRGVSAIESGFYGIRADEARARFDEALQILLLGLSGASLSFEGKYHRYEDVPLVVGPRQTPRPPIFYPSSGTENLPWAAESGFHTVLDGPLDHVAAAAALYRSHLQPANLPAARVGLMRFVVVAPTDAEAYAVAEPAYVRHRENLSNLARTRAPDSARPVAPDSATRTRVRAPDALREAVADGWAAVGSPAAVADQMHRIGAETGCNYVIFAPIVGDLSTADGLRTVSLFAEHVMPAIGASASPDALAHKTT